MAKKEIAVKKYVVKLSAEERDRLEAMVRAGKNSAQILTRARILLKADVSDAGEGWSDSAIAAARHSHRPAEQGLHREVSSDGCLMFPSRTPVSHVSRAFLLTTLRGKCHEKDMDRRSCSSRAHRWCCRTRRGSGEAVWVRIEFCGLRRK